MPDSNPVDIIKAKRDAAETDCNNLAAQAARHQNILQETQTKLFHAQGRYAAHVDDLKTLEPETAEAPQKADPA